MNPYNYVLNDLNLNILNAQGEWSWVTLILMQGAAIWDDDSTHSNPYREILSRLPVQGYAVDRMRQLLNPGLVKFDQLGR